MGFWHTGYAEFHEPSGLEEYVYSPPPPVRYVCEHCSESFAELEGLRRHRFEQHPVRQPALWLRGRAAGALPQLLMTPLQPADVFASVGHQLPDPSARGSLRAQRERAGVFRDLDNCHAPAST